MLFFVSAWGFYFYVRVRYTIPRNYVWYSWTIFGFELLASSNMFIHCLYMLRVRKYHQGKSSDTCKIFALLQLLEPAAADKLHQVDINAYTTALFELVAQMLNVLNSSGLQ